MITLRKVPHHVDLPNPVLGDSEQVDIKVKYEYSMSKNIHSSIKTPAHAKFLLKFEALTTTQKDALTVYLGQQLGCSSQYQDYNGDWHSGFILGDVFEFIQVSNKNVLHDHFASTDCEELWSITLEFEESIP